MTQIIDITLFCSKFSGHSMACVNFIRQNKISVLIVPLDNEEDRALAMNNENVKITSVPSLVVAFSDGKVQMFIGFEKIIDWFNSMRGSREQNGGRNGGHSQERGQKINDESESSEEPPPPKKRKTKTSRSKKKRESAVEIIIDDVIRPTKPPPPPTQGLLTAPKPSSSNKNLMNAAKEMENARNATLGIRQGET